jgi:SAM-dependent methyltransferase
MLTVRYERLGLRPGDRLLDVGAGAGRHAFEGMRRGATVVALDADRSAVESTAVMIAALGADDGGPVAAAGSGTAVVADALALPFRSETFDRVIAAEILEHVRDDRAALVELCRVLRPGGTIAVTVPRWGPERITWALSEEYHQVPGGHVRIYRRSVLASRLCGAGLLPYSSHHAHALHTPYWWLKAAVGVSRGDHRLVNAYHRLLVWDITRASPVTRVPEAVLNPVLGKSAVFYARKPA